VAAIMMMYHDYHDVTVLAFSVTRIMVRSVMAVALPSKDAGRCHPHVAAIMISFAMIFVIMI
jgi:hypothetical protein